MSTNKDDTLRQFCDVTGADEDRSKFFLESSNWQLEVALSSFYENGGNVDEAPTNAAAASAPVMSDSDMDSPPVTPLRPQKKEKKKSNTKFATLGSLQNESSSDEEEGFGPQFLIRKAQEIFASFTSSEPTTSNNCVEQLRQKDNEIDQLRNQLEEIKNNTSKIRHHMAGRIQKLIKENDNLRLEIARLKGDWDYRLPGEEEGQAFYAGGSERSGQQIIGPGKARKDIVTEMFKSVRERGAVVFEDQPSSTSRGRGAFSGVGYRLGQTNDDHEAIGESASDSTQQSGARSVRLCLYREGYTVDGGPLRHYADPNHAHFLNCIRQGEIPPELSNNGSEVRVSLEDRRHEACPRQTASRAQVFAGKGHMLGSPTPATVGAVVGVTEDAADRAANHSAAQRAVELNENRPVTTVQFRLADGSVLTGRFNLSHTVGDLQEYVRRAEPAYCARSFALCTSYPRAELADPAATIEAAQLANCTLMQSLK